MSESAEMCWETPEGVRKCQKVPESAGMYQKVPEELRSRLVIKYYWLVSFCKFLINTALERLS